MSELIGVLRVLDCLLECRLGQEAEIPRPIAPPRIAFTHTTELRVRYFLGWELGPDVAAAGEQIGEGVSAVPVKPDIRPHTPVRCPLASFCDNAFPTGHLS